MSRTENKSRGAQLISTPDRSLQATRSGRCWQGWGVIFPVPSYPPTHSSLLFCLFWAPNTYGFQVASYVEAHFQWTLNASKGAPNFQTSVGVSGLSA